MPFAILRTRKAAAFNPVTITNQNVAHTVGDPADATATYTVGSDRLIKSHGGTTLETWLNSAYLPANFEVRATLQSGNTPTGTLGAWSVVSTSRSWTLSQTVMGTKTCQLLIEIGNLGAGVALDSAVVTITADVS